MTIEIVLEDAPDLIEECAHMMSISEPWSTLGFSLEQCREVLSEAGGLQVFVKSLNGQVRGFLATFPHGMAGEPIIEYLCIDSGFRSQGLGTELITFFEDKIFPSADNFYMLVSDINPRARALYERLGYREVGELPDYNLPGQKEFIMRKSRGPRQSRRLERYGN